MKVIEYFNHQQMHALAMPGELLRFLKLQSWATPTWSELSKGGRQGSVIELRFYDRN
jgi:hypothetical protein